MAANVELMFYVREKPWHGLGTMVAEAPDSTVTLRLAGQDWNVIQKDIVAVVRKKLEFPQNTLLLCAHVGIIYLTERNSKIWERSSV